MTRRLLLACLLLVGAATACSDDGEATGSDGSTTTTAGADDTVTPTSPDWLGAVTTAPTTPEGIGEGWAPEVGGRTPLAGFGEVAAVITAADGTECEVCLLAALDDPQRARGLMEVTDADLGGYDGMVFVFSEDVQSGFWMRNTRLPLSIAYFDADGVLVSQTDMEPCPDEAQTCPSYPAEGAFRYAVEVPQGNLDDVGVVGPGGGEAGPRDAVLELTGSPCPEVDPGSASDAGGA